MREKVGQQSNFLMHELVFWSPFSVEGISVQPRYRREGLGPASSGVTDFVDSLWDASSFLRSGWAGVGRRWEEHEEEREWKLGLACKIRLS